MEEEYLKRFEKALKIKPNKNIELNMPLLEMIFERFEEDLYTTDEEYEKLRKKQIEIYSKLESTLKEEQIKLFNEYWKINSEMKTKTEKQLFIFGYIIACEIKEEIKINE